MVAYEYVWIYSAPARKVETLGVASTLWDLIENMHRTKYPLPKVTLMRTCMQTADSFAYLFGHYQVHKVVQGQMPSAEEILSVRNNKLKNVTVEELPITAVRAVEYALSDPGYIAGK